MRDQCLNQLVKNVLFAVQKPVAKVRLAKLTYFVFKDLVRNQSVPAQELAFIRMPLGPVPDGFMQELADDKEISIEVSEVGLLYNKESYSLTDSKSITQLSYLPAIHQRLRILNQYPTSTLVELSHQDYSWLNHANGDRYFLLSEDLQKGESFAHSPKMADISVTMDNQLLQSKLVNGMVDEMVKDNTDLEYARGS